MAKLRELIPNYTELLSQGLGQDELIAIAQKRVKSYVPPVSEEAIAPQAPANGLTYSGAAKEVMESGGVLPQVAKGLANNFVRGAEFLNGVTGIKIPAYDKLVKLGEDLEAQKEKRSERFISPDRKEERDALKQEAQNAQGFWEDTKAGVKQMVDTVTHPSEWTIQGATETLADWSNPITLGAGKVASTVFKTPVLKFLGAGVAGMGENAITASATEYAIARGQGKSVEEAKKIATQAAAGGAAIGAPMGMAGSMLPNGIGKQKEIDPSVSEVNGFNAKAKGNNPNGGGGGNGGAGAPDAAFGNLGENDTIFNFVESEIVAQKNDVAIRGATQQLLSQGVTNPMQLRAVIDQHIQLTPMDTQITLTTNGAPLPKEYSGSMLPIKLTNTIEAGTQSAGEVHAKLKSIGASDELANVAAQAVEAKNPDIFHAWWAKKLEPMMQTSKVEAVNQGKLEAGSPYPTLRPSETLPEQGDGANALSLAKDEWGGDTPSATALHKDLDKSGSLDEIIPQKPIEESAGDVAKSTDADGRGIDGEKATKLTVETIDNLSNNDGKVIVEKVSKVEADALNAKHAFKHPENITRTIDHSQVVHTLKNHGNETYESSRGNVAVTKDDIANYLSVVKDYDLKIDSTTRNGKPSIVYGKQINGYFTVVEEIRTGKSDLAFFTMRKTKGTLSEDALLRSKDKPQRSTSETVSSYDESIPQKSELSDTLDETPELKPETLPDEPTVKEETPTPEKGMEEEGSRVASMENVFHPDNEVVGKQIFLSKGYQDSKKFVAGEKIDEPLIDGLEFYWNKTDKTITEKSTGLHFPVEATTKVKAIQEAQAMLKKKPELVDGIKRKVEVERANGSLERLPFEKSLEKESAWIDGFEMPLSVATSIKRESISPIKSIGEKLYDANESLRQLVTQTGHPEYTRELKQLRELHAKVLEKHQALFRKDKKLNSARVRFANAKQAKNEVANKWNHDKTRLKELEEAKRVAENALKTEEARVWKSISNDPTVMAYQSLKAKLEKIEAYKDKDLMAKIKRAQEKVKKIEQEVKVRTKKFDATTKKMMEC